MLRIPPECGIRIFVYPQRQFIRDHQKLHYDCLFDLSSFIRLYANLASYFSSVHYSRGQKRVNILAAIYLREACSHLMTTYWLKELYLNENKLAYLP